MSDFPPSHDRLLVAASRLSQNNLWKISQTPNDALPFKSSELRTLGEKQCLEPKDGPTVFRYVLALSDGELSHLLRNRLNC